MHLLIDGKNILYRALFAADGDNEFVDGKRDKFAAISRFLHYYFDQAKPGVKHIHVFWDAPKSTIWRRAIHPLYKEGRSTEHAKFDIEAELKHYQEACEEIWYAMGIRQYKRPAMEADDLIYAFCMHKRSYKIMVVSSDSDLLQIPYAHDNVTIFSPHAKAIVDRPTIDPVTIKCLQGDSTDNVDGYDGIGEVKSRKLAESDEKLYAHLRAHGDKVFRMNRSLIDLSLCPFTTDNIIYIIEKLADAPQFNPTIVKNLLHEKYKMRGMVQEYPNTILPFSW